MICGKRWIMEKSGKGQFTKWLYEKETGYAKSQGISM